ncbi:MAG: hypothetical protein ACAH80_07850 [Alphaproteobacteria bacterium]
MAQDPEPSHRRLFQLIEQTKQIDRSRASWNDFYSRMRPQGRSSAASLCAVAGIVMGAFSFTKSDFFLAPVLGAVAGLCLGWFFGWCLSRSGQFLFSTLPRAVVYYGRKVFRLCGIKL